MKEYKRVVWGALAAIALLLGSMPTGVGATPHTQEVGQNLLQNPGFEGINCPPTGWCEGNWTRDTFNNVTYAEIFSPEGWITFWSEGMNSVDGRNYGRPECQVIPDAPPYVGPPARVRNGNYALKQFGFYHAIDSGVYQVVDGLTPGGTVQASAYAHAWTCGDDRDAYSCGDEYQMLFRVGIDPNGGTNPWSPSVVWAGGYSYDEYSLIGPVETQVGESGAVTMFLRATAKWSVKHNDVYWDDASLVYTTPPATPTNTPLPPPPTSTPGPSPTPLPTPTPRPDGAIVHIVQPGDTLYGVALQYGVPVEQIEELNAGSIPPNKWLTVGQELVIGIPSETPTPSPPPTPEVTPTPETASICVLAYHDRNGDTFRQADTEEPLPNAVFSVSDSVGLLEQYTTDGLNEPYCFTGLTPGTYRVEMRPPEDYTASGPSSMAVGLVDAASTDVVLGAQRGEMPGEEDTGDETADEPAAGEEGESIWPKVLRWGARVSGVLMLVLAIAVAVIFVLNRRR
ncbi:MAG: LysM peptidoglycan-binding domain-containing protein [Anaerolineae bacterium]